MAAFSFPFCLVPAPLAALRQKIDCRPAPRSSVRFSTSMAEPSISGYHILWNGAIRRANRLPDAPGGSFVAGADARLVASAFSRRFFPILESEILNLKFPGGWRPDRSVRSREARGICLCSFHPDLRRPCGGSGAQQKFHSPLPWGEGGRARRPGERSSAFKIQNSLFPYSATPIAKT